MTKTIRLCQEMIWTGPTSSTYCMREEGHTGKHNIVNREPEPCKEKIPVKSDRDRTGA